MTLKRENNTFEAVLDSVLSYAGHALIPNQDLLRSAARQLPPAAYGTLEIRLAPGDGQVDISIGFPARQFNSLSALAKVFGEGAWLKLRGLLADLASSHAKLEESILAIGLEFDLDGYKTIQTPGPSIFLVPSRQVTTTTTLLFDLLGIAMPRLVGQTSARALLANSRRLFESLPSGCELQNMGAMLSRNLQALRFQFRGLDLPETATIFKGQNIAWPLETIKATSRWLDPHAQPTFTCLDMAPDLLGRIGLEFSEICNSPAGLLPNFLDLLVQNRLCCPEKAIALTRWAGQSAPFSLPRDWKEDPSYLNNSGGSRFLVQMRRRLSHIKLILDDASKIEAKAYLEFFPVTTLLK